MDYSSPQHLDTVICFLSEVLLSLLWALGSEVALLLSIGLGGLRGQGWRVKVCEGREAWTLDTPCFVTLGKSVPLSGSLSNEDVGISDFRTHFHSDSLRFCVGETHIYITATLRVS